MGCERVCACVSQPVWTFSYDQLGLIFAGHIFSLTDMEHHLSFWPDSGRSKAVHVGAEEWRCSSGIGSVDVMTKLHFNRRIFDVASPPAIRG